ncbi:YjgF/Yer057p/UK114 family [Penicillium vulpinum]|uniref:Uncharacterized protein n=1 Tax=Penicillium vulpinum TaxID=29845 RepID=A0A1V6RUY8_9EURO|nr:YjgF/Yer057p/UK114 family [Penicillium vulpinum]KAJ5951676.1 YjgF/Yer057p/UK114 family [Penicillium vulpinum]OQE05582.1 hypothetical protein PENVUL_c023G03646 [Penicillium vulpinum]
MSPNYGPEYTASKLTTHGLKFYNWAGAGEQAAEHFGLSHAVIIPANARRVLIGGQLGIRDDGTIPTDPAEEADIAFEHVERALKAAGFGDDAWEYVYKINTYEIAGEGVQPGIGKAARKYLKNTRPAWTGVNVASLVMPGLHLEIEVEAYLPN